MSTLFADIGSETAAECPQAILQLISRFEATSNLHQSERLVECLTILDTLDVILGNPAPPDVYSDFRIIARLTALQSRLEAINGELYEHARSEIARLGNSTAFCQWLLGPATKRESSRCRGLSFDLRDEIVSGVLRLREPESPEHPRSPEMLPYQPTPVRHILDLIATARLSNDDVLVDLGSGLGHVPLLVSILTGNKTLGIELQPSYVASARECAETLRVRQTQFVAEDARVADLSNGTVFYPYTPFTGSILTNTLARLRKESTDRQIRICSLGPCTCTLKNEAWLWACGQPETERIAEFKSL